MNRVRNIKTGNVYIILGSAIDQTNDRGGRTMIIYHPEGQSNQVYTREAVEFTEKFESLIKCAG